MNHEPAVGMIIGERYELLEPLGSGGLAHVFLARDHKDGSEVVVKYACASDDGIRAHLLREARLLSQLTRHTTGVAAYRDLVQDHGEVYLVVERVYGALLREWEHERSRREILSVYTRLASVLHEIHTAGFVHRDMSPLEVMVVENGAEVKIIGVTRAVELGSQPDDRLLLGNPIHKSPETLKGELETAASDVYSLGVMLSAAITGRFPFASGIVGMVAKVLTSSPDLGDLDNSELGTLIRSMLALEPEARPSAQAVAHALAALAGAG